jgi:hypothetical protein
MARLHTTIKLMVTCVPAALEGLESETISGPLAFLLEGEATTSLDIARVFSDGSALLLGHVGRVVAGTL